MNAVRAAHAAFEAKCEASLVTGQKLFARIRESSKYFGQSDAGQLFPVVVTSQKEYTVVGGPGGQYRLKDVDLFVSFEEGAAPIQITFEA
jgi:hypothetical protein